MNLKRGSSIRHLISTPRLAIPAVALIMVLIYLGSCFYTAGHEKRNDIQIALDWNRFILDAEVTTEGFRGPVAARVYGYVGLAAYEAALPGFDGRFSSMAENYSGLKLPPPPPPEKFNLSVALNAAYNTIISRLFLSSPETVRQKRQALQLRWEEELKEGLDVDMYHASVAYGMAVGQTIYKWSITDTLGNEANLHNYDRLYKPPVGEGKWVTSIHFPMPALLPYWEHVRTFVIDTADFIAKPLPPYSVEPYQHYHTQALEVMTLSTPLSSENKWIADFWNDDRPGLTFSPAGHWLEITNQVIAEQRPSIEKTLETYLKIGFVLSDAMVACWKSKYEYNLERPETFIQKHLVKDWRPYSPSPPFPSYPSGHSMMGAAAARVLTHLYGENYSMIDRSHEGLPEFVTKSREFKSFEEMAKENALSRILLGVHYRMDCEEGLRLGELIGAEVSNIALEKELIQ